MRGSVGLIFGFDLDSVKYAFTKYWSVMCVNIRDWAGGGRLY